MWRLANQGRIDEGGVLLASRKRTSDSLDSKRAIDTTSITIFNMIVRGLVQILRVMEEIGKKTTRLARFSNRLSCGESISVFSKQKGQTAPNVIL